MRLRAAAAAAYDLALGQGKLREPHAHGPDIDSALHRGQLARWETHQSDFVRQHRRLTARHVRLHLSQLAAAPARSHDGSATALSYATPGVDVLRADIVLRLCRDIPRRDEDSIASERVQLKPSNFQSFLFRL